MASHRWFIMTVKWAKASSSAPALSDNPFLLNFDTFFTHLELCPCKHSWSTTPTYQQKFAFYCWSQEQLQTFPAQSYSLLTHGVFQHNTKASVEPDPDIFSTSSILQFEYSDVNSLCQSSSPMNYFKNHAGNTPKNMFVTCIHQNQPTETGDYFS